MDFAFELDLVQMQIVLRNNVSSVHKNSPVKKLLSNKVMFLPRSRLDNHSYLNTSKILADHPFHPN